jgi:hypothetical protein
MKKMKLIKVEYHTDPQRSVLWTARVVSFSIEEAIKSISLALKRNITVTSVGEIGEIDAFSAETMDYVFEVVKMRKNVEEQEKVEKEKEEAGEKKRLRGFGKERRRAAMEEDQ